MVASQPKLLSRYGRLLPMLLPLVVTWIVYLPVCGFGFLNYDDSLNVYANPLVRGFDWSAFLAFWREPYQGLYIPLTYTLWGLLAKLSPAAGGGGDGGLVPGLFHALNLFLHLASVGVVFSILRLLIRDDLGAGAGALLFGLHPVQVEAVAWVTGLKDLLGGFLALLAIRLYLLYHWSGEPDGQFGGRYYWLATLSFLAALLAKPSGLVVPLLLASAGYLLLRRPWLKLLRELGPWLIVALAVALVTGMSQDIGLIGMLPTVPQRFLVIGDTYTFYLSKLVFPLVNGIDYGRTPAMVLAGRWIWLTGLLSYPLIALFFWRVREPVLRLAAVLFLLAILPVSGLFSFYFQRLSTVADRYLYLAMLGPALGVAWLVACRESRLLRGVVLVVLGIFAILSCNQVMTWGDFERFYRHNLWVNPNSWFVRNNFGAAYDGLGELEKAEEQYRQAILVNPAYSQPIYNLGMIRMKQGRYSEAAGFFRQAVGVAGRHYRAYFQLGNALAAMGKEGDAIAAYRRVIEIYPRFPEAYVKLARLYDQEGRPDLAAEYTARGRSQGVVAPADEGLAGHGRDGAQSWGEGK